jgi:hypothetical protein
MPAPDKQWEQTVGDVRTMRLRGTDTVVELVAVVSDTGAAATLNLYDVTGPLDADGASMNNAVLRESRPATGLLLDWVGRGRQDQALWAALKSAGDTSTERRQTADEAASAAVDAVAAVVPDVDRDELADAVRRVALAALRAD